MGKDAPDPPDFSGIAAVSEAQAKEMAELAREQLEWSKTQWAEQKEIIDPLIAQQIDFGQQQFDTAQQDRQRYEELYQPIEEDYLTRAQEWDSPERRKREAAEAQVEVAAQFEAQRQNALRRLEGYGVDPSQTRNHALDLGVRVEEAKAKALAGTRARDQAEREGMGMLGETINVGRGLPSQGLQYSGQALAANTAAQQGSQAWQQAANAIGSPTEYYAGSGNALGNQANALGSQYNAQIGQYNANAATSPWNYVSQALGGGIGFQFAEGGEAAAIPDGSVQGPGGPTDDAIPANLSDGEYVIPADVVMRKGTEFFDKLITKTKEEQMQREEQAQVGREAMAIPPQAAMKSAQGY
jgi:hypothetical protein